MESRRTPEQAHVEQLPVTFPLPLLMSTNTGPRMSPRGSVPFASVPSSLSALPIRMGPPFGSMGVEQSATATGNVGAARRSRRVAAAAAAASSAAAVVPSLHQPLTHERASRSTRPAESPPRAARKRRHHESQPSDSPPKRRKASSKSGSKKRPPGGLKRASEDEDDSKVPAASNCCICMSEPKPADLAEVDGCEHRFCFDCISTWADRENTCPLCKARFLKIDRVNKTRRKKGEPLNSKEVKDRDQRSDLVSGAALEGLFANLTAHGQGPIPQPSLARLIFSAHGNMVELHGGGPLRRFEARRVGRSAVASRAAARLEDSLVLSSEDDDEPSSHLAGFLRAVGSARSVHMMGLSMFHVQPSRSYASNVGDRTAGREAQNPLEIEDDSDDDEVEVVRVGRARDEFL